MTDLRFDNQRGSSVACDLVDVVRCKDWKGWQQVWRVQNVEP